MTKANLSLYVGDKRVEREQLALVPTPAATKTWQPIPHAALLGQVERTLLGTGLSLVSEAHGLAKDGNRYFGLLQVSGQDNDGGDYGLVVGVRNSHDQSFPAGLVIGSSVFVCSNLAFSGEVKLSRKHTVRIMQDLPQLVDRAVGQLGQLRHAQEQRFLAYQQHEVNDRLAHDLIIRALDAGVIPVTRIPEVLTQWREPNHPEFREGGKTLWRLFNGVSECLKGNLDLLPKRTMALHGLCDMACGLIDPASANRGAVALAV